MAGNAFLEELFLWNQTGPPGMEGHSPVFGKSLTTKAHEWEGDELNSDVSVSVPWSRAIDCGGTTCRC